MKRAIVSITLLTLLLPGCKAPAVTEAANEKRQPAQIPIIEKVHPNIKTVEQETIRYVPPATAGKNKMEKTCQNVTFNITPEPGTGTPNASVLSRANAGGARTIIQKPAEMHDYTAVALGCGVGTDGKPYFVVQYGELEEGCAFCEWFYLYDASGKPLTKAVPPIFEDKSLPPAQQQYPNNQEYNALLKQLGMTHPEMDYLP